MISRILLCSDGSDHALKAAQVAAEMAEKFNAPVTLLSVFTPPPMTTVADGMPGVATYIDIDTEQAMSDNFHNEVQEKTAPILNARGVRFQESRELGQPVETITRIAESMSADLIVLGSRGMGGFKRLLVGSVSDGVVHHAHCAVLIVR